MKHGTITGYNHHKCRCEECTAANTERRAEHRTKPEPVVFIRPTPQTRGLTPMSDLDLALKLGWGDTLWNKLPADWRERQKAQRKRA